MFTSRAIFLQGRKNSIQRGINQISSISNSYSLSFNVFSSLEQAKKQFFSTKSSSQTPRFTGYPGAPNAPYTQNLDFIDGTQTIFPIYSITDADGNIINKEHYERVLKDVCVQNFLTKIH